MSGSWSIVAWAALAACPGIGTAADVTGAATSVSAHAEGAPAAPGNIDTPLLAADTEIVLVLQQALSTKSLTREQVFAMRTLAPIALADGRVLPAGLAATGQVVHVQKARAFGRAAELILAARELTSPIGPIALRAFAPRVGEDRIQDSAAVAVAVGVFAGFVRGGHIELPAGTEIVARVARDIPASSPTLHGDEASAPASPLPEDS